MNMKILAWDIETTPIKAYTWSLWPKAIPIEMVIETQRVACVTAKWVGQPKVIFRSTFHHGEQKMLEDVRELHHEADAVLSWNGRDFDTPHMNRAYEMAGVDQPSPYKEIDLMRAAKKSMRFASNKLDHVARELGFPGKIKTDFDLWLGCMAGDEAAWRKMRRYNRQDVLLLEDIYDRLKPWIPNPPNAGLWAEGDGHRCPYCESDQVVKEGFAYTSVGKYQRYSCKNCGGWSREGKRVAGVDLRAVA